MPKELEERLTREADNKGLKGERRNAYIYGTMRNLGWKPKRETEKQATQLVEFLGLLDKIAESRWPYEQKRRIENLNKAVNSASFPGKTAKRIERIVQSGSAADSALLRSARLKKILGKFASEKQALWGKTPAKPPPKLGVVERMINFPFKHPKLTMFGGGLGLGYWLANKKQDTTNNYYQDSPVSDNQAYGYQ